MNKYIHTITPVFFEGLDRGVPMYTYSSPVCLMLNMNKMLRENKLVQRIESVKV